MLKQWNRIVTLTNLVALDKDFKRITVYYDIIRHNTIL